MLDLLKLTVRHYGADLQMKKLKEELEELTEVVDVHIRREVNPDFEDLVDEIADVENMLDQIKIAYNLSDAVSEKRIEKMLRQQRRIAKGRL